MKDYILMGRDDDLFLNEYIALVVEANLRGVDVFSVGILDRPAFFERRLRRWIEEGLEERRAASGRLG